jgi:hypothetical protein
VNEADQITEQHRAEASDDAESKSQQSELHQRQLATFFAFH